MIGRPVSELSKCVAVQHSAGLVAELASSIAELVLAFTLAAVTLAGEFKLLTKGVLFYFFVKKNVPGLKTLPAAAFFWQHGS